MCIRDSDVTSPAARSGILDKYTIQERVIPLLKGIKTKEPAVMMAALSVFRQATHVVDLVDYCATEILPLLWQFSLGPLLNLEQFQSFMILIKSLSARIEREQTRKLQELSANGTSTDSFGNNRVDVEASGDGLTEESDFQTLVSGRRTGETADSIKAGWDHVGATGPSSSRARPHQTTAGIPSFSWSSASPNKPGPRATQTIIQDAGAQAMTPDNAIPTYTALMPSNSRVIAPSSGAARFTQPLHSTQIISSNNTSQQTLPGVAPTMEIDWTAAAQSNYTSPGSLGGVRLMSQPTIQPLNKMINGQTQANTMPNISSYRIAPPLVKNISSNNVTGQKQGLDKYESLI